MGNEVCTRNVQQLAQYPLNTRTVQRWFCQKCFMYMHINTCTLISLSLSLSLMLARSLSHMHAYMHITRSLFFFLALSLPPTPTPQNNPNQEHTGTLLTRSHCDTVLPEGCALTLASTSSCVGQIVKDVQCLLFTPYSGCR